MKETMKTNTTLTKLNLDGSGEESQMRLNQQFHFVFVFISNEPENNAGNRGETAMNGSFNANMPCDTYFFRKFKRNPLMFFMIHSFTHHKETSNGVRKSPLEEILKEHPELAQFLGQI